MAEPRSVLIVTPAGPGQRSGNRITALRIAALLRSLGHRVRVRGDDDGAAADLLLAIHAAKTASAVQRFRDRSPASRIAVLMAGTDIYPELDGSPATKACLQHADRIVALQGHAIDMLPSDLQGKARVIVQSAGGVERREPDPEYFDVCLLAHLRPVKDPLLAAEAVALLPPESRVRVLHAGKALDQDIGRAARAAMEYGDRYQWLGPLSRRETRELLAGCRLLLLTSRHEGGANAISEALAAGLPVLATDIPGTSTILGRDYPGLFPVGDARALADLLERVESQPAFLGRLEQHCRALMPQVQPDRERQAWGRLLAELFPGTLARS